MFLKVLLILFAVILLCALVALWYYGAFHTVVVRVQFQKKFYFAYEKYVGPYKDSGKIQDKVYYALEKDGIKCTKGFGFYWDDPKEVPDVKCRSLLGDVVREEDYQKIVDDEELSKKYKVAEFPGCLSVVSSFPFKGIPSVIFGIFKVYPRIKKFLKLKKFQRTPSIEIYDVPKEQIQYIFPYPLEKDYFDELIKDE